tara:strand:- start:177 stop:779 length:603 start_codon:yes stop_codon:yes gene_type:complete
MEITTFIKYYKMLHRLKINDLNVLNKTLRVLKEGGIIAYPTDTIYGFGCDALNKNAIKKLNLIKGRIQPMSVLCPNIKTGLSWLNLENDEKVYAKTKLTKGHTIIAPVNKNIVSRIIMGKNNSLGIRIPNHEFCKNISNSYINPITTTSVNKTGEQHHTDPNDIEKRFKEQLNLLIDDGIIIGKGSAIHHYKSKKWVKIR